MEQIIILNKKYLITRR